MAKRIDGKAIAAQIKQELKEQVQQLAKDNITVTLAVIQVGQDPASCVYVRNKQRTCEELGIHSLSYELEETTSEEKLLSLIQELNAREDVDGILVQLPLPRHIDEQTVIERISPDKDVDAFHPSNVGRIMLGLDGFAPCTPQACMEILDYYGIDCTGKKAVVIGRSLVVGKPAAMMLLGKNATVTICHTKTRDVQAVAREADILVSAAGVLKSLTKDYVRPGQIVIDVSMNWDPDKVTSKGKGGMAGDAVFTEVEPIVEAITPVPGGVGAVTTSVLIGHVVEAAERTLA